MRGDFVIKFLETARDIVVDIFDTWSHIPYKGVRYRYNSFEMTGYDARKRYIGFKNLERRGFIKDKESHFVFTENGCQWLHKSFIRYFKNKTGVWDKKWRVIIFDVPKEFHKERIRFGRKLKSMGLFMLQKSVFVFPYPCDEEVGDIAKNLKISNCIDVIIADSIGFREKELLKFFDL